MPGQPDNATSQDSPDTPDESKNPVDIQDPASESHSVQNPNAVFIWSQGSKTSAPPVSTETHYGRKPKTAPAKKQSSTEANSQVKLPLPKTWDEASAADKMLYRLKTAKENGDEAEWNTKKIAEEYNLLVGVDVSWSTLSQRFKRKNNAFGEGVFEEDIDKARKLCAAYAVVQERQEKRFWAEVAETMLEDYNFIAPPAALAKVYKRHKTTGFAELTGQEMSGTKVDLPKDCAVFNGDGSLKGKDNIENDKTEPEAMSADKGIAGLGFG